MKTSPHKPCRPPEGATEVERWTGTRWIPDDGKPGLAFSGMSPANPSRECVQRGHDHRYPAAWTTGECVNGCRSECVSRKAMARTCARFGAANGRRLEIPVKTKKPRKSPLLIDILAPTENFHTKLEAGAYMTKLPFPSIKDPASAEKRKQYRAEQARLEEAFKDDMLAHYGVTDHPKAQRAYEIAWSHGHAAGFHDVASYFAELVDLLT